MKDEREKKESDKNFFKDLFNKGKNRKTEKKHKRQTKDQEFNNWLKAYVFWNNETP